MLHVPAKNGTHVKKWQKEQIESMSCINMYNNKITTALRVKKIKPITKNKQRFLTFHLPNVNMGQITMLISTLLQIPVSSVKLLMNVSVPTKNNCNVIEINLNISLNLVSFESSLHD